MAFLSIDKYFSVRYVLNFQDIFKREKRKALIRWLSWLCQQLYQPSLLFAQGMYAASNPILNTQIIILLLC